MGNAGARIHQVTAAISTQGGSFHDITEEVARVVEQSAVVTGLCTVFLRHTSASLVVQENADPAVLRDLARWMERLTPESAEYEHDAEGPDDMPSHLRSAVTRSSESIPVTAGRLALGTWQAIYLWEHRRAGHRRQIVIHVAGV
jgi:secondary thiamine-phosphate synthase enzyme